MNSRKLFLLLVPIVLAAVVLTLILRPWDTGNAGPAVICLDPGHGGTAAGAEYDGRLEKDDNLRLALRVRDLLEDSGSELTVVMTRTDDSDVELQKRCDIASDAGATLFVSLHRNSGGGEGVETWTMAKPEKADTALAKAIHKRLADAGVSSDRGVRSGTAANPDTSYYVLANTSDIPSCLVEVGFIDSSGDNALFDENFEAYAAAIADGILEAAGLK